MDVVAASMTPPQQGTKQLHRHIPMEIVEEILLNLEVKSLLRFSSISKSWHSTIFERGFVKRYRREGVITINPNDFRCRVYFCGTLSDLLSDNPMATPTLLLDRPSKQGARVIGICGEFCCIEDLGTRSLSLWNPWMGTYRKLPDNCVYNRRHYGLGYDSVDDDYKILQLKHRGFDNLIEAELYSLRSDSWKKIQPFPETSREFSHMHIGCSFVSGALHWLLVNRNVIISFNLSMETYGEVMLPTTAAYDVLQLQVMRVVAAIGKLCLLTTYLIQMRTYIGLWVMEDYGVVESWTNKFDIAMDCCKPIPNCLSYFSWKPLYFGDDGRIVIVVFSDYESSGIYVYNYGDAHCNNHLTLLKKCDRHITQVYYGELFVQSLVSPATYR